MYRQCIEERERKREKERERERQRERDRKTKVFNKMKINKSFYIYVILWNVLQLYNILIDFVRFCIN